MRYSKDVSTGVESAELVLIKGTEVEISEVAEPAHTANGDIFAGDSIDEMPLYHIVIDNMILSEVNPVFDLIPSIHELNEKDNEIAAECDRLNEGSFCQAQYTVSDTPPDYNCWTHCITRPRRHSPFIYFKPEMDFGKHDIFKIDGSTVDVKALGSGAESFEYIMTNDSPVFGFYDEANLTFYVIPASAVIHDGQSQYIFEMDAHTNLPVLKSYKSEMYLEGHRYISVNATLQEGVTAGNNIIVDKIGPLVKVFGRIRFDFKGDKMTLLKICTEDGTLDGIDLDQSDLYPTFFNPCEGYKIARLEWQRDTDGKSLDLVLMYVFDSATGKRITEGNYWVQINSEYYSGY